MKLWDKNIKTENEVLKFTVGNDPQYDKVLAPYDIVASLAHAIMLQECGLLSTEEKEQIGASLLNYYPKTLQKEFQLHPDDEDIHSHLENYLVSELGDAGKKIHTARSRNDQVMVAMQLLMKEELRKIIEKVLALFEVILQKGEENKEVLIPGYTHTQVAMPSSGAIWLGAYAESLVNDLMILKGVVEVVDQNSLGSAAGFGTSFNIDRELTTQLAGFGDVLVSSASAQLSRGKHEANVAFALASIACTLSRMSGDMILYMSQELNIISFPGELTTGSSIMPHKKNPDVLELIRAHSNIVGQLPGTIMGLTANLISGYHRDFQLIKEQLLPAFDRVGQCLSMMELMINNLSIRKDILDDPKYRYIFSVEVVNQKVMQGKTFRDAYREVGEEIENNTYAPGSGARYTHLGSIGNPGLDRIRKKMEKTRNSFHIRPIDEILEELRKKF